MENSALSTLFKILDSYGSMFSPPFWQLVFRGVVLPIFDNVRHYQIELIQEVKSKTFTRCCVWILMVILGHGMVNKHMF